MAEQAIYQLKTNNMITTEQQQQQDDVQRLFGYLKNCKFVATKAAPCILFPYGRGLWTDLIKANADVNLRIRYSSQNAYNKRKITEELFNRPENAVFNFFEIQDNLAAVPVSWRFPLLTEPFIDDNTVFFHSDTTAFAPPFQWRDQESFKRHFNSITKGVFRHVDFTHASIAGHSILTMLQLSAIKTSGSGSSTASDEDWTIVNTSHPEYFHVDDLNVYIHGDFKSENERRELATQIVDTILRSCSEQAAEKENSCGGGSSSTTSRPPAVERNGEKFRILIPEIPVINIIPSFKPEPVDKSTVDSFPPLNRAQLLHEFDIDSYCFAYDGARVWTTLRGVRAACSKMNVANPWYKSSSTYEDRLAECRRRGYTIAIPEADSRHLHVRAPRFELHAIDIPRLYNICFPEDKVGGNGIPGLPRDLSPVRVRKGFLNTLRWILEPLW